MVQSVVKVNTDNPPLIQFLNIPLNAASCKPRLPCFPLCQADNKSHLKRSPSSRQGCLFLVDTNTSTTTKGDANLVRERAKLRGITAQLAVAQGEST